MPPDELPIEQIGATLAQILTARGDRRAVTILAASRLVAIDAQDDSYVSENEDRFEMLFMIPAGSYGTVAPKELGRIEKVLLSTLQEVARGQPYAFVGVRVAPALADAEEGWRDEVISWLRLEVERADGPKDAVATVDDDLPF